MDTSNIGSPAGVRQYTKRIALMKNSSNDSGYTTLTPNSSSFNAEISNDISFGGCFYSKQNLNSTSELDRSYNQNSNSSSGCDNKLSEEIALIRLNENNNKNVIFHEAMETDSLISSLLKRPYSTPAPIPVESGLKFGSHQTPKSVIGKANTVKEKKITRKQEYRQRFRQKLGTPEKNEILYSNFKPVTPPRVPRALRSPPLQCKKTLDFSDGGRVDFLQRLEGFGSLNSRLMSYLSEADLVNVCKVSAIWESVCHSCPKANRRREKYLRKITRNKENIATACGNKATSSKNVIENNRQLELKDISNVCNILNEKKPQRSPPVSPNRRKHHKFAKAASMGSEISQRSCIKCENPAILHGRWAECQSPVCLMVFCSRCHYDMENCEKLGCKFINEAISPNKEKPKKISRPKKMLKRLLF